MVVVENAVWSMDREDTWEVVVGTGACEFILQTISLSILHGFEVADQDWFTTICYYICIYIIVLNVFRTFGILTSLGAHSGRKTTLIR